MSYLPEDDLKYNRISTEIRFSQREPSYTKKYVNTSSPEHQICRL
jgi:hypothetical protein